MKYIITLFMVILLSGCANNMIKLPIEINPKANLGKPFYVLITDDKYEQYLSHATYQSIYAAWQNDPNMEYALMKPQDGKATLLVKKDNNTALYFLFSQQPVTNWKVYLDAKQVAASYITISEDNDVAVIKDTIIMRIKKGCVKTFHFLFPTG